MVTVRIRCAETISSCSGVAEGGLRSGGAGFCLCHQRIHEAVEPVSIPFGNLKDGFIAHDDEHLAGTIINGTATPTPTQMTSIVSRISAETFLSR